MSMNKFDEYVNTLLKSKEISEGYDNFYDQYSEVYPDTKFKYFRRSIQEICNLNAKNKNEVYIMFSNNEFGGTILVAKDDKEREEILEGQDLDTRYISYKLVSSYNSQYKEYLPYNLKKC